MPALGILFLFFSHWHELGDMGRGMDRYREERFTEGLGQGYMDGGTGRRHRMDGMRIWGRQGYLAFLGPCFRFCVPMTFSLVL
jgi:hypothetical protein